MESRIDTAKEIEDRQKELEYQRGFVASVRKKLDNEKFVLNAPAKVVDREKKKLQDGLDRIAILEDELEKLGA